MTQPRDPMTSSTAQPTPERSDAPRIKMTVPHTGDAPVTALVVGHGLDPASQEALRTAVDLTQRLHAHLHVVHGVDLGDYPIDPDAADWEEQAERALAKEYDQVGTALAGAHAGWTYHACRGDPVSLLAAVAEEHSALMIIVGTRGEGFVPMIERMLGRSVSHGVIHRQHRPVLVVPSPRSS